jgi:HD domain-containing protein
VSQHPGEPTRGVPELAQRFDVAVAYARTIHADQVRKGTRIPYVAHLLSVAALVIEDGATDEDLVIGALLHDAAEDCGGRPRLEDVRSRFGDAVAAVVEGCTDTFEDPKPPWRPRKEAYIEHLRGAIARGEPFVAVSLADKLHNARAILADLRELGPAMFQRFTAGRDNQLWYYRSLVEAFRGHPSRMADELERVVAEIGTLAENLCTGRTGIDFSGRSSRRSTGSASSSASSKNGTATTCTHLLTRFSQQCASRSTPRRRW